MPKPKVPAHRIAAALQDVADGLTQAEAAAKNGFGARTMAKAVAQTKAAPSPHRAPGIATPAPQSLLETLTDELTEARHERKHATSDAQRRAWSKRVEDLVRILERIAPPPPVPPDQVAAELRRLDREAIELIEQFLDNPIDPRDA